MKKRSEQSERSPERSHKIRSGGVEGGWKDIPIGGMITEAGSAKKYETGTWRTFRPVVDKKKCINCLRCWLFCPDSSIKVKDKKMAGFDYDHCKGCGICASVCPVKCIKMEKDRK